MTTEKQNAHSYNFYGAVGAVQTGANAVSNITQSLGADDKERLKQALREVQAELAACSAQGGMREEPGSGDQRFGGGARSTQAERVEAYVGAQRDWPDDTDAFSRASSLPIAKKRGAAAWHRASLTEAYDCYYLLGH